MQGLQALKGPTRSAPWRRVLPSALVLLAGACLGCAPCESPRMKAFPRLMLWAWERDEDLRSLPPARAGVAYLRQTLRLRRGEVEVLPRRQPLRVPDGIVLLAVTRIEADPAERLEAHQAEVCVDLMVRDLPVAVRGLQVDFDARVSQRPFYRLLLGRLRARMDAAWPLSMTALASWALFDDWIRDLPVDEVVPMCFDMGADTRAVREHLRRHRDFRAERARTAIGTALEEPLPWMPRGRRTYVFSHRPWGPASLSALLRDHP